MTRTPPASDPSGHTAARRAWVPLAAGLLLILLLGGCESVFYQPDRKQYATPEQYGLWHEVIRFRSADGTVLSGWFLPAEGVNRGTVIHFHGNAANISNHLFAVRWLPKAGYSVFLFDYRGYGDSAGDPTREGVIADGVAAIQYVRGRKDVDPNRVIVFGQSLGGAIAISATARAGTQGIGALVVEASFLSYRDVVRRIVAGGWLTWAFQYPVSWVFSDALSPSSDLPRVANLPFLVIHGEADRTVPWEAGKDLFDAFPGADKDFWSVPGAGHLEIFSYGGSPWRDQLLAYFANKLGKPPQPR